jgi:hypothetical protein
VFKPTPIDQLRRPHPDQERIDAESARLLRSAAQPVQDTFSWRLQTVAPRPEKKNPS